MIHQSGWNKSYQACEYHLDPLCQTRCAPVPPILWDTRLGLIVEIEEIWWIQHHYYLESEKQQANLFFLGLYSKLFASKLINYVCCNLLDIVQHRHWMLQLTKLQPRAQIQTEWMPQRTEHRTLSFQELDTWYYQPRWNNISTLFQDNSLLKVGQTMR